MVLKLASYNRQICPVENNLKVTLPDLLMGHNPQLGKH